MIIALVLLAALNIGAVVLLLTLKRENPGRKESVVLKVQDNLGDRKPNRRGHLTWFSLMSPPVVLTDPGQVIVENVLVLEQYPLFPVVFFGRWIPPGELVSAFVTTDPDGNLVDIRITV